MPDDIVQTATPAVESQTTNTAPTQTPADSSTPAASTTSAAGGFTPEAQTSATEAKPTWTPNTKFKFMDQEREFDEWAKKVISQDNEAQIRELYEKAYGLDFVKQRFHKTREELQGIKQEYGNLKQTWDELSGMYRRGDLGSFFDALQIPKDKIIEFAAEQVRLAQMPAEERARIEKATEAERKAHLLEKQNQEMQERYEQEMVSHREYQLSSALSKPEVAAAVQAFDARFGAGAFRARVIKEGIAAYQMTGKDISPDEAIQEVMALVGPMQPQAPSPAMPAAASVAPPQANAPQAAAQPAPPVIPNVSGRNSSPAKKAPRSLEDLKKLADEISA